MIINRVIPCLLLRNKGLVKSVKFKDYTYIGDPINAVKIFNEKEVDELIFLDIEATTKNQEPPYKFIEKIATECFMPFCYGGGITTVEQIRKLSQAGAEKVAINTHAFNNHAFIQKAAEVFGSSTIVVGIDVKKNIFGKYQVQINAGKKNTKLDPVKYAIMVEKMGAGEIFLNSIDNDGMMQGYDLGLVKSISEAVSIPIIASGGAGNIEHIKDVINIGKASAAAAGSMFVYHGKRKGVLISYPSYNDIKQILSEK